MGGHGFKGLEVTELEGQEVCQGVSEHGEISSTYLPDLPWLPLAVYCTEWPTTVPPTPAFGTRVHKQDKEGGEQGEAKEAEGSAPYTGWAMPRG